MSDELPLESGLVETPAAAPTTETPASEPVAETNEVSEATYDWNGEIPALVEQDWFKELPDETLKDRLLTGYKQVRENATRAVTKHTTAQAEKSKQLNTLYEELAGMRASLASKIEELSGAMSEDADENSKVSALKTGYEAQLNTFKEQMQRAAHEKQTLYSHNQAFANEIKTLRAQLQKVAGQEDAIHQHYQGKVEELVKIERNKAAKMESELTQLRSHMDQIREQRMVAVFESAFPHLKASTDDGKKAMDMYFSQLSALYDANPSPDSEMEKRMTEFAQSLVNAKWPNRNPAPAPPSAAESVMNPPSHSTQEEPKNKWSIPTSKVPFIG